VQDRSDRIDKTIADALVAAKRVCHSATDSLFVSTRKNGISDANGSIVNSRRSSSPFTVFHGGLALICRLWYLRTLSSPLFPPQNPPGSLTRPDFDFRAVTICVQEFR
jgi:hypothetical protein